jgi:hypothetical protein
MGYDASWPLLIKDNIKIDHTDKKNWLKTTDTSNKCLRYAKWENLN